MISPAAPSGRRRDDLSCYFAGTGAGTVEEPASAGADPASAGAGAVRWAALPVTEPGFAGRDTEWPWAGAGAGLACVGLAWAGAGAGLDTDWSWAGAGAGLACVGLASAGAGAGFARVDPACAGAD